MATLFAEDLDAGSTDNCGSVFLSLPSDPDPFLYTCDSVGLRFLTMTVTDGSGNMSTCVTEVTVLDTVPPVAICATANVSLDTFGMATITWEDADGGSTDACGIDTILIIDPLALDFDCNDHNMVVMVEIEVIDNNNNRDTCTAELTIVDDMGPIFDQPMPEDVAYPTTSSDCQLQVPIDIPTLYYDNCSVYGDIIISIEILDQFGTSVTPIFDQGDHWDVTLPVGDNMVIITATDILGNETDHMFVITIFDDTVPQFNSCPDDIILTDINGSCDEPVSWTPPIVSDNCSGLVVQSNYNPGDLFPLGTTVVTYIAVDPFGANVASCSFNVTIIGVCDESPDLFPTYTFGSNVFQEGDIKNIIVNLNEINGENTNGVVSFFVPNLSGYTITFDGSATSVPVFGPEAVDNVDWVMTDLGAALRFDSKPGVVIPANSRSRIAIQFEAEGSAGGTSSILTTGIVPDSGGDVNDGNNSAVLYISIVSGN